MDTTTPEVRTAEENAAGTGRKPGTPPDTDATRSAPAEGPGTGRSRAERAELERLRRVGFVVLGLTALLGLAWLGFEGRVASDFHRTVDDAPSRVYARPLVLRAGASPDREAVEAHLLAAGYRPAGADASGDGPRPGEFRLGRREWRIAVRSHRVGGSFHPGRLVTASLSPDRTIASIRDGADRELDRAELEPALLAALTGPGSRDRIPVPLEEMPEHLVDAVLAVEDRRFREHAGLDLPRIGGALVANLKAGRVTQGASTLTQQLVRSLFLSRDRTFIRKAKEAALALALERRVGKDEILEGYVNHIYLGNVDGVAIHGFGRAANGYFGKDVTELGVEESALLAGLVRAPNLYSPYADSSAARQRRDLVLRAMAAQGRIDAETLARALEAPAGVRPPRERDPTVAPYFAGFLAEELEELAPDGAPGRAGIAAMSTLSPGLQRAAESAVADGLAELERWYPYQLRAGEERLQGALVALDPRTGEILAMVGGRDYAASEFNRATDARRQPGSVFKPIVALTALTAEGGVDEAYTLGTVLEDAPITIATDEGPWSPVNHDGEFRGPMSLRGALVASRNLPFVRIGLELGPGRIVETARALGIRSELRPVPSLALGSSEVTLLEITAAYGVLAAEGVRATPHGVREIRVPGGPRAPRHATTRAVPAAAARRLTSALEAVVSYGTGVGVRERGYGGAVAAKSGSTDDYRDAWFVGYTPELAVGVWVGFDSGAPIGLPGNTAALPIFTDFLKAAPEAGIDGDPAGADDADVGEDVRGGDDAGGGDAAGAEDPGGAGDPAGASASSGSKRNSR